MGKIAIKNAAYIATFNQQLEELTGADILIANGEIVSVGVGLDIKSFQPDEILNAENYIVLPGLVNTHHHLYQTLTRCIPRVQSSPLFDWLINLYEIWRELTPEAVYWSSLLGFAELIRTGCTTTTDQHYVFPRQTSTELIDVQIQAAREIGIRFHPCRGSMSRGKSKEGLPPDDLVQSEDEILADSQRLIEKYHDPKPLSMCRLVLAPCSPFSVSTELLIQTAELARCYENVRLHTHIAETLDEEEYCLKVYGYRPAEYMAEVGWMAEDVWYAHCVHLNLKEIHQFATYKVGVAHCPTSNMLLGSGVAPITEMLKAGVEVGLAVDGSASNDSSNMLLEARQCMLLQRARKGAGAMNARQALKLATRGGAAVLGRPDIGSIAPGKAADLVLINLNRLDYAGALSDPVSAVIHCGDSFIVDTVIINGRIVAEGGKLKTVDEQKITEMANKISREMIARASQRTGIDFLQHPQGRKY